MLLYEAVVFPKVECAGCVWLCLSSWIGLSVLSVPLARCRTGMLTAIASVAPHNSAFVYRVDCSNTHQRSFIVRFHTPSLPVHMATYGRKRGQYAAWNNQLLNECCCQYPLERY